MSTTETYCDQLRLTMKEHGLSVSPVTTVEGRPCLRFDAVDITETGIIFLWLGKPVFMARRSPGNLVHVTGEMMLELH